MRSEEPEGFELLLPTADTHTGMEQQMDVRDKIDNLDHSWTICRLVKNVKRPDLGEMESMSRV